MRTSARLTAFARRQLMHIMTGDGVGPLEVYGFVLHVDSVSLDGSVSVRFQYVDEKGNAVIDVAQAQELRAGQKVTLLEMAQCINFYTSS